MRIVDKLPSTAMILNTWIQTCLRQSFNSFLWLVLTSAGKFVENKLLSQTAADMQSHANPKCSEYMPSTAIRFRVVSSWKWKLKSNCHPTWSNSAATFRCLLYR